MNKLYATFALLAAWAGAFAQDAPIVVVPDPRLYGVMFSAWDDEARWTRELALTRELGIGGVRTGWALNDILMSDKSALSNWGRNLVAKSLRRIKAAGLRIHVSFNTGTAGVTPDVAFNANKWVMDETAAVFGPLDASFSLENEPTSLSQQVASPALVAESNRMADYLASSGLQARGYYMLAWPLHGWFVWPTGSRYTMAQETHRHLARTEWLYNPTNGYRTVLDRTGAAFNLYVDGGRYDPVIYGVDKATELSEMVAGWNSAPQAITEFDVQPGQDTSYWRGYKRGKLATALLALPRFRFVTAYCINEDKDHAFILPDGKRDQELIRGFKDARGLP